MPEKVFIGVDSGGTSTAAVAVSESGRVLGRVTGGQTNHYASDLATARKNLKTTVDSLLEQAGLTAYEAIAIGLSSLDYEPDRTFVASFVQGILPVEKTVMHSDVYMALMGMTLGRPGIMVVSGTGSMAVLLDQEKNLQIIGGWGYLLQDPGSAYALAIQGIDAALKSHEGLGPATLLEKAVLDHFKVRQHRQLIDVLYNQPAVVAGIAGFGKVVIEISRQGDEVARAIVARAVQALAGYACRLVEKMARSDCIVGMAGSVLEKNPDLADAFASQVKAAYPFVRIGFPELDPETGAALYAMEKAGCPASDKALARLKKCREKEL